MILVDIYVPSIGNTYDFQLDEEVPVGNVIEEISEMIGQKEAAKYCAVYLSLCLSAVVLTVPIWIYTGVFYL